jgi:hypothetical protein
MPLIAYRKYNPRKDAKIVIQRANEILEISRQDGFGVMTLRQLYYQFVARNWIVDKDGKPENTLQQYKKLGRIISDAREGGMLDWFAIEDGQRNSFHFSDCPTPQQLLEGIEHGLLINPWHDQDVYVETWVEKQSLEATIGRPCDARRSPYMACKGYLSSSEAWRAGRRYEAKKAEGKRLVLLHLGDHDPSGIDMTRDNKDRLEFFAREHGIQVFRLALNMDQVEEYGPPPNFAKQTDSRYAGYEKEFGDESWELDALRQSVIGKLITDKLDELIDKDKWEASMAKERQLRVDTRVGELASRWEEVHKLLLDDGLPMDRLKTYEDLLPTHMLHVFRERMREAAPIVLHHNAPDRDLEFLSDALRGSAAPIDQAMGLLDEIVVNAEKLLPERLERRAELAKEREDAPVIDEVEEDYETDEE